MKVNKKAMIVISQDQHKQLKELSASSGFPLQALTQVLLAYSLGGIGTGALKLVAPSVEPAE